MNRNKSKKLKSTIEKLRRGLFRRKIVSRNHLSNVKDLSDTDSRVLVENIKCVNNNTNVDQIVNEIESSGVNQPQEFFKELESNSRANLPLEDKCEILTRIYLDIIEIDEIKNSYTEDWDKELLLIAYYEKHNQKNGISYIKELKKKYITDPEKLKKLNILFSKFSSNNKTKIFHAGLYEKYLDVKIDSDRVIEFNNKNMINKSNEVEEIHSNIPVKETIRKEEKKIEKPTINNFVGSVGITNNRYNSAGSSNKNNDNNSSNIVKERILSINDVFEDEIIELRKYIYALMMEEETRKVAVQAWDKLELLMDKPITAEDSLKRLLKVLKRLEELNYLKIDKEKVKKYSK